ncbi:hypothetical protein BVG19_g5105 [[Candida] boidinii]|nr:hypothetical protein BVG19_g5105 [[Candida] boidinii]OWB50397.1 hypothetical protein B5S27_g1947 [[Candida] boidinii]
MTKEQISTTISGSSSSRSSNSSAGNGVNGVANDLVSRQEYYKLMQSIWLKSIRLERLTKLNKDLKTELNRERITNSNSSLMIINYCDNNNDYLINEIWGELPNDKNKFKSKNINSGNGCGRSNNINDGGSDGCCIIM